jgi:hypothetical protein
MVDPGRNGPNATIARPWWTIDHGHSSVDLFHVATYGHLHRKRIVRSTASATAWEGSGVSRPPSGLDVHLDVGEPARGLTLAEQQTVEIAKAADLVVIPTGQTIDDLRYIVRSVPIEIIKRRAVGYRESAAERLQPEGRARRMGDADRNVSGASRKFAPFA